MIDRRTRLGGTAACMAAAGPLREQQAHTLPTIFSNRTYLRAGGLMSYGPDLESIFQRAAYFVDRVRKGAKPIDLPIEQLTTFHLVLNQRTARAFGLRFPQSLLIGANEVIE